RYTASTSTSRATSTSTSMFIEHRPDIESHLEDLPSGWPHFFPKTDVYTPFCTVRRPNPVMAGILPDA
ncbi:hypothetical protein, partial [Aeromonas sp. 62-46]|uniref:hypothetical protein n=1 Tax=Aeromonas sp. 62-46 TaxID=1895698 RepID=UPI00257B2C08